MSLNSKQQLIPSSELLFNTHTIESLPYFNDRIETCHILHSKENSKQKKSKHR